MEDGALSAALPPVSVVAVCPATCAHKCRARRTQTCRSCLHPEMGAAGWLWLHLGPVAHAWLGAASLSLRSPPVHSSAQCCGYAHMHLLHRCTGGLLLLLLELLSALCIKQFSSSCFLLSFLLCLKLPPVPLHCQLPLCLFLLNSFFHLGFFFTKQTSSSSLCSLSTL